jgi:hypothetical protein
MSHASMALIMLWAVGCADSDPKLAGTYEGKDYSGNETYPANWTVVIDKMPSPDAGVTGSYHITGINLDNTGAITGTFTDPDLSLVLTATDSAHCGYTVTATWDDGVIHAKYATRTCFIVMTGELDLEK